MILNYRIILPAFLIFILCCSCASSHKVLTLGRVVFNDRILCKQNVVLKISNTDIVKESGNKHAARKAQRNNLQFISLCMINNGTDTFTISKAHTEIFSNYEPVLLLDKNVYYKKIRQKAAWYSVEIFIAIAYYFPLSSTGINFYPLNPTGILLPVGFYNIHKALKANKELKKDIAYYDVLDKKIAPGDTLTGFICIKTKNTGHLMFRFK